MLTMRILRRIVHTLHPYLQDRTLHKTQIRSKDSGCWCSVSSCTLSSTVSTYVADIPTQSVSSGNSTVWIRQLSDGDVLKSLFKMVLLVSNSGRFKRWFSTIVLVLIVNNTYDLLLIYVYLDENQNRNCCSIQAVSKHVSFSCTCRLWYYFQLLEGKCF